MIVKKNSNSSFFILLIGDIMFQSKVNMKIRFITLIISLLSAISFYGQDYSGIETKARKLKEDGKLDAYENDIQSSNSYKEKKYCTIIANENIYNIEKNFLVIPIQKVTNVYKCSMENGKISANDYICIETAENEVYGIAYKIRDKKDPKFDNLLNQIKQRMVR